MSVLFSMAVKDLRLLLRDKLGMFFILVFPLLMGLLFGMIGGSIGEGGGENALGIAVFDDDGSELSKLFVNKLDAVDAVDVRRLERGQAQRQVRQGRLLGTLDIPKEFGRTAGLFWMEGPSLVLGVDPSRKAEAAILQGSIMQAMGELAAHRFTDIDGMRSSLAGLTVDLMNDDSLSPAQRTFLRGLFGTIDTFLGNLKAQTDSAPDGADAAAPSMQLANVETVDITARVAADPNDPQNLIRRIKSKWDLSFPAAILWGVMGCVAGFAVSIARERTAGTFYRLQIAPVSRMQVLLGKGLACFLAVLGVVTLLMVIGLALGIQLASPALLVFAAVSLAFGFVGLMMLMAVLGRSEQAVAGAGWAIIVTMCMFGGGMIPLLFMPKWIVPISNFSPVKWGILALEGAIWRDFTLSEMLLPCGILLAVGTGGFALGTAILSRESA